MKIDVKTEIRTALLANSALTTLVGKDVANNYKIYQLASPYADAYPRITFFEIDNADVAFADDIAIASDVPVQIDVWSKGSTSAIAGEVDKTMKSLGFARTGAADFYETGTTVYHKAMRFRAQFEEE